MSELNRDELLLITPPYHCGVVEVAGRWLPLNLLYVAAAARSAGVEPVLYDAMSLFTGWDDIRRVIRERQPRYVGTYAITATIDVCLEMGKIVKQEGTRGPSSSSVGSIPPSCGATSSRRPTRRSISSFGVRAKEPSRSSCGRWATVATPTQVDGLSYRPQRQGGDDTTESLLRRIWRSTRRPFDIVDWSAYRYFVVPESRLGFGFHLARLQFHLYLLQPAKVLGPFMAGARARGRGRGGAKTE